MKRFFMDCRDYPSEVHCTVALFAATRDELLEAVIHHRRQVHGNKDTPQFRANIAKQLKEAPPLLRCHRL
jgi:hypothetical protein